MLDLSELNKLDGLDEVIRNLVRLRNEWKTRLDKVASLKGYQEHATDIMCVSSHLHCDFGTMLQVGYRSRFTYNNANFDGLEAGSTILKETSIRMQETRSSMDATSARFRDADAFLNEYIDDMERSAAALGDELNLVRIGMESMRNARRLASLPDEVLACVFEHVVHFEDSSDAYLSVTRLSYVCRRFRAIAVRIPRLWSIWTREVFSKTSTLAIFNERSRNSVLRIGLTEKDIGSLSLDQAVVQHAHRITALDLYFRMFDSEYEKKTVALLSALPSLQVLNIGISEADCGSQGDAKTTPVPSVIFFNLSVHYVTPHTKIPLIHAVQFPNLESLLGNLGLRGRVEVEGEPVFSNHQNTSKLFPRPGFYPNLVHLFLLLAPNLDFSDYVDACPKLEHLELDGSWSGLTRSESLPPLRTLHVHDTDPAWVDEVVQNLKRQDGGRGWERFEKLIVDTNCKYDAPKRELYSCTVG